MAGVGVVLAVVAIVAVVYVAVTRCRVSTSAAHRSKRDVIPASTTKGGIQRAKGLMEDLVKGVEQNAGEIVLVGNERTLVAKEARTRLLPRPSEVRENVPDQFGHKLTPNSLNSRAMADVDSLNSQYVFGGRSAAGQAFLALSDRAGPEQDLRMPTMGKHNYLMPEGRTNLSAAKDFSRTLRPNMAPRLESALI